MGKVRQQVLLVVPLAQRRASLAAERTLRRMKLLLVPEESLLPDSAARQRAGRNLHLERRAGAFATLLSDPALVTAHRMLLPQTPGHARGEIDAALAIGLAKLDDWLSLSEADAM